MVVSSSSPSSPRKTRASAPRRASTPAITGASRGSLTPTAWAAGRAGFDSGPRTLKTVGTASSRRGTAVWRIPGWNTGAKQKAIPAAATHGATAAGRQVDGDAERLEQVGRPAGRRRGPVPVLDHRHARRPATTRAAIVEMLTVLARSPPVPHVSTARTGTSTRGARSSMASTSPATSSGVSPLARSATRKPATWTGEASPSMISRIAQVVSSAAQRLPGEQADQQVGPGGHAPLERRTGTRDSRRRSCSTTAVVSSGASTGCGHDGVGEGPGRQPRVVAAGDEHERGRAVVDLVLDLLGQAHPAGRPGLAVEDQQVDAPAVDPLDHLRAGRALDPLDPPEVGGGPTADGAGDLAAHGGVVAVDHDDVGARGVATGQGVRVAHAPEPTDRRRRRRGGAARPTRRRRRRAAARARPSASAPGTPTAP